MRPLITTCATAIVLSHWCGAGSAAIAQEERIHEYQSRIVIHEDGSMVVTETVTVTAAGKQIKRGIYRDLPTVYPGPLWTRIEVPLEVNKVLRDGRDEPYHTKAQSNGLRIYIGRENVTLPTGRYTYTIQYTTDRVLGFFEEHDELYWNVTGNDWSFPIEEASATVVLPVRLPAARIRLEGYTGPQGAKAKDLTSSVDEDTGNIAFETTRALGPREGLTIVAGFPKGVVREPPAEGRWRAFFAANKYLFASGIGVLVLLGYYLAVWIATGRDPSRGTIIPLFEPPAHLGPAATRFVYRRGYDRKCFAAALINMAVKGHLRITEKDGEYTLQRSQTHKNGRNGDALSPGEKRIGKHLLKAKSLKLSNASHSKISKAIRDLKAFLKLEFDGTMFLLNRKWFFIGFLLSLLTILAVGLTGSLEQILVFLFFAVWLTVWSIGVAFLVGTALMFWWTVITQRQGAGEKTGSLVAAVFFTLFSIPFVTAEVIALGFLIQETSVWLVPLLVAVAAINVVFFYLLERPTHAGRELLDQIEGFRMYLATAERLSLEMLHPPERTPELFEKYLPYALALDVENEWAEQFADVLSNVRPSGDNDGYSPDWYRGPSWNSLGSDRFASRVGGFASGLGSSLGSAIVASSSAPGSSSGFSGGGGGGGSSGGGGGGGGGGGW